MSSVVGPKSASHGSIRMPELAAAQFYPHVRVGTPVQVDP
jgi:lipoprotein-anchoring transpeptidase ErfK/SrfK